MGYLNNTTVTVDAILTKKGRELLARGGNAFNITSFALAMPNECKIGNAVESYRNYYMVEKRRMASWKNRETPEWFN